MCQCSRAAGREGGSTPAWDHQDEGWGRAEIHQEGAVRSGPKLQGSWCPATVPFPSVEPRLRDVKPLVLSCPADPELKPGSIASQGAPLHPPTPLLHAHILSVHLTSPGLCPRRGGSERTIHPLEPQTGHSCCRKCSESCSPDGRSHPGGPAGLGPLSL